MTQECDLRRHAQLVRQLEEPCAFRSVPGDHQPGFRKILCHYGERIEQDVNALLRHQPAGKYHNRRGGQLTADWFDGHSIMDYLNRPDSLGDQGGLYTVTIGDDPHEDMA